MYFRISFKYKYEKDLKMKNHYIPQFIIKKFSKAINVFNLKNGNIRENRPSFKVFYEKGIYDDEVEKTLNFNIETPFSKLLDDKLLTSESSITITREELLLIKRYMLVSSIRAQGEEHFREFLIRFKRNTDIFYSFNQRFVKSTLPYTEETTLSNRELLNNALLAFSKAEFIEDLAFNNLCTKEMVAYAAIFLLSYITFWDAPNNNEFVLSDVGMISEYEGFHSVTGGLDLSKLGYLYYQLLHDKERVAIYADLISSNAVMYENYDIFNISKNRCLIMVSPFFRQFFSMNCSIYDKNHEEITVLPKPDMWPAVIQNVNLFEPPKNQYMISTYIRTKEDLYIYEPKKLNQEELIYINSLLIIQSKELIGFDSPKNIFPSIEFSINQKCWFGSVKNLNITDVHMPFNYFMNATKEPLQKLAMWCQKYDVDFLNIDKLFNDYMDNLYKDFRNNIYIYEYLLDKREQTYNCNELDFLGKGNKDEKMKYIEKEYNRLKELKNDFV